MRLISFFGEILPLIALFVGNELYNIFVGAALSVLTAILVMMIAYLQESALQDLPFFRLAYLPYLPLLLGYMGMPYLSKYSRLCSI